MAGMSDWNVKPDREADAHPREEYDAERNCYFYKRKVKNRFIPNIELECDIVPAPTEEYAEIIKRALREQYPDLETAGEEVPFALQLCVYPAHIYAGGVQPYVVGESVAEWTNWLLRAFSGVVWASEKQVCVSGTEIRHRDHEGVKIRIYAITEQLPKKE